MTIHQHSPQRTISYAGFALLIFVIGIVMLPASMTAQGACPHNVKDAGEIGNEQFTCNTEVPATINSINLPSGGRGEIEYLWLRSHQSYDDINRWTPIPNSNSASYSPGLLDETTFFVRCSRREGCTIYRESNIVQIHVKDCESSVCADNVDIEIAAMPLGPISFTIGDGTVFDGVGAGPYPMTIGGYPGTYRSIITSVDKDLNTTLVHYWEDDQGNSFWMRAIGEKHQIGPMTYNIDENLTAMGGTGDFSCAVAQMSSWSVMDYESNTLRDFGVTGFVCGSCPGENDFYEEEPAEDDVVNRPDFCLEDIDIMEDVIPLGQVDFTTGDDQSFSGIGYQPHMVDIGNYRGEWQSVITSIDSALNVTLTHYFDDGQGNTFWVEERAVKHQIGNTGMRFSIDGIGKVAGGTGDFACATGNFQSWGILNYRTNRLLQPKITGDICGGCNVGGEEEDEVDTDAAEPFCIEDFRVDIGDVNLTAEAALTIGDQEYKGFGANAFDFTVGNYPGHLSLVITEFGSDGVAMSGFMKFDDGRGNSFWMSYDAVRYPIDGSELISVDAVLTVLGGAGDFECATGSFNDWSQLDLSALKFIDYGIYGSVCGGCEDTAEAEVADESLMVTIGNVEAMTMRGDCDAEYLQPMSICKGSSIDLNALIKTENLRGLWTNGFWPLYNADAIQDAGTYYFQFDNQEGCRGELTIDIKHSDISANLGPNVEICQGESTILIASGGETYLWSNGERDNSIEVTDAGNYGVLVVNENRCYDDDRIEVELADCASAVDGFVTFTSSNTTVRQGDIFTLNVGSAAIEDIKNFGMTLRFDPDEVKYRSYDSEHSLRADINVIQSPIDKGQLEISWSQDEDPIDVLNALNLEFRSKTYSDVDELFVLSEGEKENIAETFTSERKRIVLEFVETSNVVDGLTIFSSNPNPFEDQTTIQYYAPADGELIVETYNSLGAKLTNEQIQVTKGHHSHTLYANDLKGNAGVLYIHLTQAEEKVMKRIIQLR